jgi:hypothetical protein
VYSEVIFVKTNSVGKEIAEEILKNNLKTFFKKDILIKMKAMKSRNRTKQLMSVISMLLFLFLVTGSLSAQESSSKPGSPHAMLFTLVSSQAAEDLGIMAPSVFEEGTIISFSMPRKEKVELALYDKFGNEIAELVNDMRNPGSYSENLDCSKLKAGVYYYRLTIGGDSDIKKILLSK